MNLNSCRANWMGCAIAATLLTGGLFTWWTLFLADRNMRDDLLRQTSIVAQGLNIERIQELTGKESDMRTSSYLRIKEQLATVRSSNPLCRFLYLIGRKLDGTIFFFVDSEPAESKDCSPAGQVYVEAPQSCRRAFASHSSEVEGPYTDRWGTWTSGFVPIHARQMLRSQISTEQEAQNLVHKAVSFYKKNGRELLVKELNQPASEFCHGDLYAFAYDSRMTLLAHPTKPELVGQNLLDKKDWAGGKYFRKEIQDVARTTGRGWVSYEYANPANTALEPKKAYFEQTDDLVICAGTYCSG